jgi:hypothetical protein
MNGYPTVEVLRSKNFGGWRFQVNEIGVEVNMNSVVVRAVATGAVGAVLFFSIMSSIQAFDGRADLPKLNSGNFSHPLRIDNKWMPLQPGTQLVFTGSKVDEEDHEQSYELVLTVTDLVKEIQGIESAPVLEQYFTGHKLEISRLAFHAQDNVGNVWLLGEAKEYFDEHVKLIGARMWAAGVRGSRAGISIPAKPAKGMESYSSGFVDAPYSINDRGQVLAMGAEVKVPAGSYSQVLVTEEGSKPVGPHPRPVEVKYYAPGVGYVKVNWAGKDPGKNRLELAKIKQLSAQEMGQVRDDALAIEERAAYYGRTTEPPRQARAFSQ